MTSSLDRMAHTSHPPLVGDSLLFVISGCSGSGKSTLIAALAKCGELVVPEPGREIVRQQLEEGGDGVPWKNAQRFIDLCAEQATRDFDTHAHLGRRVFFDRSFIDVAAAVERTGLRPPHGLELAVESKRYAPQIFMSPPWEALFQPDSERRHGFTDAVAEYDTLVPTYRRHGYELVLLPEASLTERVEFVLSTALPLGGGVA